jgi:tRNA pseudouridine55 synthase
VTRDGIALVDKTSGWTSHDVVARARRLLGTRKVGHAGTLDPDATGLLVLGVGRATRLLRYLSDQDKAYVGEAVLGVATSTLDASGEVTGTWDMGDVPRTDVRAAARRLTETVRQVPPMVSAKKVEGRRLHELAREGVVVERKAVTVRVARFDVAELTDASGPGEPRVFTIDVACSSGTYIRSLVADLGAALGGGAHLRNLRRQSVGPFGVEEAVPIEQLSSDRLLPPLEVFRGRLPVKVDDEVAAAVRHGRVLPLEVLGAESSGDLPRGPWPVVDSAGHLLAVYVPHGPGTTRPDVVLA